MGCTAVLDSHWDKGNMLDARGFMDCTWSGNAECSLSFVTRANQQILTAKYSVLSNGFCYKELCTEVLTLL